ncbi:MAG: energy transducer TonB, partial [Acidobacteriota bacterium]
RGGSQPSDQEKSDYVARGLEQIDTALQLKPEYVAALTYKSLLLRLQASLETDPVRQAAVLQQADALRDQTLALQKSTGTAAPPAAVREGGGAAPFPYPPNAVRVGGNIRPPTKIADAKPVYPVDATQARIQGVVIIEVLVGESGKVQDARVLRSIPLLDQAALDAVRQWVFTPTLLNGSAVAVIMTVTVNFTLQ